MRRGVWSRAGLGAASFWGVIGAAACFSVALLEPNMLEEGFPIHVAQRLLHGEFLYRDVVCFTGPLPFEFLALLFRLFGEHFVVARVAVVALQGFATACVFAIARRAGAGPLAHATAAVQAAAPVLVFPVLSIYFPSALAAQLAVIAVYAAVRALTSIPWAAAAGALTACVALCKQTVGLALAIALLGGLIACARSNRRFATGGAMAAGGLVIALIALAAFAVHGTVGDLFESLVITPLALGDSFRSPFPSLWPLGELGNHVSRYWGFYAPRLYEIATNERGELTRRIAIVTQILYVLPFAALAVTALSAAFRRLPAAAALHAAAVVASIAGMFPRTDWGHLSMALPVSAVQLVLVAGTLRTTVVGRDRVRRGVAWLLAAGLGAATVSTVWLYHSVASPSPWNARVSARPMSRKYVGPAVPRVLEYLRARLAPGEAIFVARQEPLLYFATGARNLTRYGGVLQGLREQQEDEVLAMLPSVRFVVMSEIDSAPAGYYAEELPRVAAYLERHFRIPVDFPIDDDQWLVVYERGPDRGATAIDLAAAAPDTRYWIEPGRNFVMPFDAAPYLQRGIRRLRRPVLAPIGHFGGGVDFSFLVPPGARFQVDFGLEDELELQGPGARARWSGQTYSVRLVRDGHAEILRSIWLTPDLLKQRTWQPLEVDLSPWAGEQVVLRLQVVPDSREERAPVTWWGSPRIVVPEGISPHNQAFSPPN